MPSWPTSTDKSKGFTLVEILVVVPIVILVVAVLIGFLVTLTGDALVSRERVEIVYTSQDALNQVEQDIRIARTFLRTTGPVLSPQGSNGGTAAFSSPSSQLIIEQYATTVRPTNPGRSMIYRANAPNPCSGSYEYNDTLKSTVIYFVDNGDLRRRTLIDTSGSLCNPGGGFGGVPVWQKNSCKVSAYTNSRCEAQDMVLASNVSNFSVRYYRNARDTSPAPTIDGMTYTAEVSLTLSKSIAGETIEHTAVMRADKLNSAFEES